MLRVGGKDTGTRFLTFVDAVLGFKHLLTQEDIDKAASLCQNLKGHLRSRFIVISDDRTPPPPPQSKKRQFSDVADEGTTDQHSKRIQPPSRPSSRALPATKPGPVGQAMFSPSGFPPLVPNVQQIPGFQQQLQAAPPVPVLPSQPVFQSQVQQNHSNTTQVQALVHHHGYTTVPEDLSLVHTVASVQSDGFKVVSGRGGRRQSQRVMNTEVGGVKGELTNQSTRISSSPLRQLPLLRDSPRSWRPSSTSQTLPPRLLWTLTISRLLRNSKSGLLQVL